MKLLWQQNEASSGLWEVYLYGSPCCKKSFCSLELALAFNSFTTVLVPPESV